MVVFLPLTNLTNLCSLQNGKTQRRKPDIDGSVVVLLDSVPVILSILLYIEYLP